MCRLGCGEEEGRIEREHDSFVPSPADYLSSRRTNLKPRKVRSSTGLDLSSPSLIAVRSIAESSIPNV